MCDHTNPNTFLKCKEDTSDVNEFVCKYCGIVYNYNLNSSFVDKYNKNPSFCNHTNPYLFYLNWYRETYCHGCDMHDFSIPLMTNSYIDNDNTVMNIGLCDCLNKKQININLQMCKYQYDEYNTIYYCYRCNKEYKIPK